MEGERWSRVTEEIIMALERKSELMKEARTTNWKMGGQELDKNNETQLGRL